MLSSIIPTIPRPKKPVYISLAFSTDLHNRNNSKDSYHATMNNMGMECGSISKEPFKPKHS